MSWNKKIKEKVRKNRTIACFLLSFIVFMGLSLFSYHPQDSSLNFVGLSTKISNYCGFVGASLADMIYQFLGFSGAWLFLLGCLALTFRLLVKPLSENHGTSFILFLVFLLSCSSLAELHFPLLSFYSGEISLGGVFGKAIISSLQPLLGKIGTGVILWSGLFTFSFLYGQTFLPFLFHLPKKLLLFVVVKGPLFWKKRTWPVLRAFLVTLNPLLLSVRTYKFLMFLIKKLQGFTFKKRLSSHSSEDSSLSPPYTTESAQTKTNPSNKTNSSTIAWVKKISLSLFSWKSSSSKDVGSDSSSSSVEHTKSPYLEDNSQSQPPSYDSLPSPETSGFSSSSSSEKPPMDSSSALNPVAPLNQNNSSDSSSQASSSKQNNSSDSSSQASSSKQNNSSDSSSQASSSKQNNSSDSSSQASSSKQHNSSDSSSQASSSKQNNSSDSSSQASSSKQNNSSDSSSQASSSKQHGSSDSSSQASSSKQHGSSLTSLWSQQSLPPLDLLLEPVHNSRKISAEDIEELSKKLLAKLEQFSIQGEIKAIKTGPALVLFEYKPEDHVKVSQIRKMESDLSLALSSESIRIIAPIPGRNVVGIEASMPYRETVYLKQLLIEKEFRKMDIPLVLGRSSDNKVGIKDLSRIPHLLVAGTTGSGKSMFIISFISSLLFRHTPDSLRLLLVDPKQVDLSSFRDIPHLLAPIISSAPAAVQSLFWLIQEMEKRYRSLAEFKVRDHKTYNEKIKKISAHETSLHQEKNEELSPEMSYYFKPLPLLCVVIEEFGDLMADPQVRRSIENAVVRLAQKARASGIHLVLAMQSPRKDVLTGLIKTNIPGRISFKVASGTDSRVILDDMGAERLLSHGDMLFLQPGNIKASRYHGPFIRDQELNSIVSYWKSQSPEDTYFEPSLMQILDKKSSSSHIPSRNSSLKEDPMYDEILNFVKSCDVISASLLQRKFQIGYPRAGRIIQNLYDKGQIGPARGSKPREVLISK